MAGPGDYHARAQALAAGGDMAGALAEMHRGIAAFPQDARLANSAGNIAMRAGDPEAAEALFAKAATLLPDELEFAINRAIALSATGRDAAAVAVLEPHRAKGEGDARYCSARANAARNLSRLGEAERWYDRCLQLAPGQARALHGRARVALERGDPGAADRFAAALAANPADAHAWFGRAEALVAIGEAQAARQIAEQLVAQAPQWTDALAMLAQMRLSSGEDDFAGHYREAARQRPGDAAIPRAHIDLLQKHERFAEALDVAREAERRNPGDPQFPLMAAALHGYLGDREAARDSFDALPQDIPGRELLEAMFRMQDGDLGRADELLDRLTEKRPGYIDAWAARDLLWRLQGDPRSHWLHGQDGLVRLMPLANGREILAQAIPLLHELHDRSAFPLGQSLRGGTQTRGNLFDRREPEFARLHDAIMATLEEYRVALPPADETHPLLRHRDTPWRISGSWSVRLAGGGDFHAAHLHPRGIISSALYCDLPEEIAEADDHAGWIELGRPPPRTHLDLGPLTVLQPEEGHLALFPSTLYHGTRPFQTGRRLTVAFDVTPAGGQE